MSFMVIKLSLVVFREITKVGKWQMAVGNHHIAPDTNKINESFGAPLLTDTSPTKATRPDATTPELSQTETSGTPVGRV